MLLKKMLKKSIEHWMKRFNFGFTDQCKKAIESTYNSRPFHYNWMPSNIVNYPSQNGILCPI